MLERSFQEGIDAAVAHAAKELAAVRAGRAVPALVEEVGVEAYGAVMPLKQLALITVPEPRTLTIAPWDKEVVASVAKALEKADLGVMPAVHGETIHVTLPSLTQERREKLVRAIGGMVEEGRIALRKLREEAIARLKEQKERGDLSEDLFFRKKEEIEEAVKLAQGKFDELREAKEQELASV